MGRENGICLSHLGHMTKMVTMPIYGKIFKKSSPEPKDQWPWTLVYSIGDMGPIKFEKQR